LQEKSISYEINPVAPVPPANDDPKFRAMSPLGKVPAYEDGDFSISDSSVILAYLDRTNPAPSIYPQDAQACARATWLEEFADSSLAEAVGPIFFQRIVAKAFFQREPDQAVIDQAMGERIPPAFDYLEGQLNGGDFLVGDQLSVADIATGSMLRTFRIAGESPDSARWPKLAAYAEQLLGRASFKECAIAEDAMLKGG